MTEAMLFLTEQNHRSHLDNASRLAVVFEPEAAAAGSELLRAVETAADGGDWQLARVDCAAEPGLAALFQLDAGKPALLIMRERVVLFRETVVQPELAALRRLLAGAAALDMAEIRQRLATGRAAGQAALQARRICPTAHLAMTER